MSTIYVYVMYSLLMLFYGEKGARCKHLSLFPSIVSVSCKDSADPVQRADCTVYHPVGTNFILVLDNTVRLAEFDRHLL